MKRGGNGPELSLDEARRVALAAQGFTDPRPRGRIDRRHLRRVLGRLELLQIDSVNVLARAHELPPFSRLGPYPPDLLTRLTYRDRELFEYWGHEASLLPVRLQPLFRWRMARAERGDAYGSLVRLAREQPDWITTVEAEVAGRGPLRAGDLDRRGGRRGAWWGWDEAKQALEWLLWTGRIAVADRVRFERLYDLTERVLPATVLNEPTPSQEEAHRVLLLIAGRALGIGTARDLADYFRIRISEARPRLSELVEDGALLPARVQGWREGAFLHPDARLPRRLRAAALLAPFDPLVWERSRVDRLFGFHLRLELYVPAAKRRYGYYVLPFLLGDRLVARTDLKADRAEDALRVRAAHLEEHAHAGDVAAALALELRRMAAWLGLGRVVIEPRGDLAPTLSVASAALD